MRHRPTPAGHVLRRQLRLRRLQRVDLARALDCSLPTATRYLADPLLLDGHQRRRLAALLRLPVLHLDELLHDAVTYPPPPVEKKSRRRVTSTASAA